jgi:NADPH2:quinone reductase
MRAARFHSFGQPLQIDEIDEPTPASGETLFEVVVAGVNPLDLWVGEGTVAGGRQPMPFVPGTEASGTLDGRRVLVRGHGFGVLRDGFYRARASIPPEAAIPIPDELGFEAAACLGVAGGTAWELVHAVGQVTADDRVLVLGASGGVGSLVVQLAKRAGATVWGQTGDSQKVDFVGELGADRTVVASAADLLGEVAELSPTLALDCLGDGFTASLVDAVAPYGRILLYGTSAGARAEIDLRQLYRRSITLRTYSGTAEPDERNRTAMEAALGATARGELRVFVDHVFGLQQAPEAHARIRERRVRGKVLLRP